MDYIAFCKLFFAATGIPVNLLSDGKPLYSSIGDMLSVFFDEQWNLFTPRHNPEFCWQTSDIEYGHVIVEGSPYDIFIGPLFTTPITEQTARDYLAAMQIPSEYEERMMELLYAIPVCSHSQALRYLMLLHLCINNKIATAEDFYAEADAILTGRMQAEIHTAVQAKENEIMHNSYAFEMQMYHLIELGDVGRLKAFLESTRDMPTEGRMAKTPLRQAKNIFIGAATKAAMLGAIPGGVDAEKVYQLVDLYVLECEQMQTIEDVHRLQYVMLMDFCQRAGTAKMPKNVSSEIYRCMTYIKNHTNESISVDDVAHQINRSRSYLMRRFKEEVGEQVNVYITKCKLEEACDLLVYGSESLSEISAYLGYSSQSYFQKVFKKEYGVTPMQYRKMNKKVK